MSHGPDIKDAAPQIRLVNTRSVLPMTPSYRVLASANASFKLPTTLAGVPSAGSTYPEQHHEMGKVSLVKGFVVMESEMTSIQEPFDHQAHSCWHAVCLWGILHNDPCTSLSQYAHLRVAQFPVATRLSSSGRQQDVYPLVAYKVIRRCSPGHLSQDKLMRWAHNTYNIIKAKTAGKGMTQPTNMASSQFGSGRHTRRLVSQTKTAESQPAIPCISRHAVHLQVDMYPCWIICTPMKVHSILQSIHDQSTCKLSHFILHISRCAVSQWHTCHRWCWLAACPNTTHAIA